MYPYPIGNFMHRLSPRKMYEYLHQSNYIIVFMTKLFEIVSHLETSNTILNNRKDNILWTVHIKEGYRAIKINYNYTSNVH